MGTICTLPTSNEEVRRNRAIEKRLSTEIANHKEEMVILLLGASESGKSTIFKQLRMYYGRYFSNDEKKFFYNLIPENLIFILKILVRVSSDKQIPLDFTISDSVLSKLKEIPLFSTLLQSHSKTPSSIITDLIFVRDFRKEIGILLSEFISKNLSSLTLAATTDSDISVPDSAMYLISNHSRICDLSYDVTVNDILRARVATTGVEEITISEHNFKFRILDVGGQRGERKKWIHIFEKKINIVIYVASLAEYDQREPEDITKSRIEESVELFETIMNSYFQNMPVILFLNKKDVLEQKLKNKPIKNYLKEFEGSEEVGRVVEFIRKMYVSKKVEGRGGEGAVYSYAMEATNAEVFGIVWKVVKSLFFEKNLMSSGLVFD